MTESDIADIAAGQTAAIAILVEELIESGEIDRRSIVLKLYDSLQLLAEEGDGSKKSAPIRHLLSILDQGITCS